AGIAAAGVRLRPTQPGSTIGQVDVWADPATGVPLQVEVTARGATLPVLVTRFLEVRFRAPAAGDLVPPPVRAGMGFAVTNAPDITGAIATLRLGPLPDRLAGQDRNGTPLARISGTAAYGSGYTQFVVLPLPRQIGLSAYRSATSAGGTVTELPGGESVLVSTPLLSVLVLDSDVAHRTYVLAGLVDGKLLQAAATELSTYRWFP
ncbi:MAG TPA: hypothetical protein VJT31_07830, partial [Rugosimonospora sp.]|nr:hypothetical protein [Rugosimonospora sp.]